METDDRLAAIRAEQVERLINPPGRWVEPPAKLNLEPGSVPEGWRPTAEDCRYWLLSDRDRDQLEAIQSQLTEPLRSRLQAMLDRLERDPS